MTIVNMKATMNMPIDTKANFYAQMARNQFHAAYVLANSNSPQIQSIIWLQLAFFSIELSIKAYLLGSGHLKTNSDLKNKVGHKFANSLKKNPKVISLFSETNEELLKLYNQKYELYIKNKFRYLSLENIFIGSTIEKKEEFLIFIAQIINTNTEDFKNKDFAKLLNT